MNWFPLMNLLIAQKKLKDNNVKESPKELILGLFPGFQSNPVTQLISTNAVVNNAITTKEKEEVVTKKAEIELKNAELRETLISISSASLVGSDGKIADNEAFKRFKVLTQRFPHIRKTFLDSTQVPAVIKETLVQTATTSSANITTESPQPSSFRNSGSRLRHANN